MDDGVPETSEDWVRECLGDYRVVRACRPGSRRTGVWELEANGKRFFLKLNQRRVRWATEVFAYQNWVDVLRPYAPELIGVHQDEAESLYGILVRSLGGKPLRVRGLEAAKCVGAYERAGALCRRLQSLPRGTWFGAMDEQGRPVEEAAEAMNGGKQDPIRYFSQTISRALAIAVETQSVGKAEQRLAEGVIEALPEMGIDRPVPAAFDYTPGNWMVDDAGKLLGVVDFENMAWGLTADPLVRLHMNYFAACPEGKTAFYRGYGRRLTDCEWQQFRIGCIRYGLSCAVVAKKKEDAISRERASWAFVACRKLAAQG